MRRWFTGHLAFSDIPLDEHQQRIPLSVMELNANFAQLPEPCPHLALTYKSIKKSVVFCTTKIHAIPFPVIDIPKQDKRKLSH